MIEAELDELDRLLAAYVIAVHAQLDGSPRHIHRGSVLRTRQCLETALVRHAPELLAAARARLPGKPMPPQHVSWK